MTSTIARRLCPLRTCKDGLMLMVLIFNIRHDLPMCQKSCNSLRWPFRAKTQHSWGFGACFGVGFGGRQNKSVWLKSIWWGKRTCFVWGFVDEILLDELHSSFFFSKNYSTDFNSYVAWSLFGRIFYKLMIFWDIAQDGAPVSEKTVTSTIPTFTPLLAGEDTSTSTTEIGGASGGWDWWPMIGEFFRGKTEKMESWVMIIEGDRFFFGVFCFKLPKTEVQADDMLIHKGP